MELLGIDIGGSGIKGAIVDSKNGVLLSERFKLLTPRPAHPDAVADVVCEVVNHFKWKHQVGVCFPTVVKKGKCKSISNMHEDWLNTKIDKLLHQHCGNKFFVLNDADAAGLSEMAFGAGRDKKGLVITITIGTGIGSGVFFNGKLIPNIELGIILGKDGDKIERWAADSVRKREDLTYSEWGKRVNFYLKYVESVMHPDLFILGGGVSRKLDRFEHKIKIRTPYVAAQNLNNAGIIGSAMFAYQNIS